MDIIYKSKFGNEISCFSGNLDPQNPVESEKCHGYIHLEKENHL